jgi:hypothetical protein
MYESQNKESPINFIRVKPNPSALLKFKNVD